MPGTDYLVALAASNGWTVDDRRGMGLAYFTRGPQWAHFGTDAEGDRVLSACGGERGRASAYWVGGRSLGDPAVPIPERGEALAAWLTTEPITATTTSRGRTP